jgi:DNA-directed RNA polymerase subunit RPC12/RpoP
MGGIALIALLAAFLLFLFRAMMVLRASWKPQPLAARCPKCSHPLPSMPAAASVEENQSTRFIFVCRHCSHRVMVNSDDNG